MYYFKFFHPSILLKLFFVFIFVANLIFVHYIYERDSQPECLRKGTCKINTKPRTLAREKWGQTVYYNILFNNFTRVFDEWRLLPFSRSNPFPPSQDLNCTSLKHFEQISFIAAGYTKSTYKVKVNERVLSLKVVNIDGQDINSCLLEEDRYLYDCYLLAASKLLKEITILRRIAHENIVQMLGYCVPADPDFTNPHHTVAIFEEFGEPVNVIKLLQISWEDRLRISLGLSRLLKHLSSFNEVIALNDFRRQQFIIINGEPKLIDVDDVGLHEQQCNGSCCPIKLSMNYTYCSACTNNVCHGYNEKLNIIRTGRHFIKHILPYGAPVKLINLTNKIINDYEFAIGNAESIYKDIEDLTLSFKNGKYRSSSNTNYIAGFKAHKNKDVSRDSDYRCWLTVSGYGCMTSVLDAEEAAEICWSDPDCKAFVLTNDTTWTGRKMVYFKNGFKDLRHNNKTNLFVKL